MRTGFSKIGKFGGATIAVVAIALATAVLLPFRDYLNPTEVSLLLLLIVLFASTLFGSRAGLAASIAGILCFNFFFLPPYYTLTISDSHNIVAFVAFVVTALIAGQLSGYAKRRAEESERRKTEIEKLYNELQNAFEQASEAEALRRSEKLKSSLLDAVTHDLRTPLTSIKAAVTTLIDENPDRKPDTSRFVLDIEARKELLEIINEETDRLNDFIGGMVELARIRAGDLETRRSWISSEELIRRALDRTKQRLKSRHITIGVEEELPVILVDPVSITEALHLILDNAGKYSPPDTSIRVSAKRSGSDMVEFSVEDHGEGISEDRRSNVFEKFYRPEGDDTAASGGLGLGLSIAKGVVESQQGKIWIEDGTDGFTTRFAFRIPIGDEERESPTQ